MWRVVTKILSLAFFTPNKTGSDPLMLIFNFLIIKKISMSFKKCHVIYLELRKLAEVKKKKKTQSAQQVMEQLHREIFVGVNCTKTNTLTSMSKTNFERKQNTYLHKRECGHYNQ